MQRTRRGLLGAGIGLAAGAAGCLGVQGVEYPDAPPDESPPDATAAGSDFSGNESSDGSPDDSSTDDGSTDDGPTADGPSRWYRLYHDEAEGERYGFDEHAGIQYGYVVRAGEFLLATGFSGDAWEERTGWQGRLADGWVVA